MATYNLSMNIGAQGIEQDRTCIDLGFDNVSVHSSNIRTTEPSVPYQGPSPLLTEVIDSSDTQKIDVGLSAHDLVVRGG